MDRSDVVLAGTTPVPIPVLSLDNTIKFKFSVVSYKYRPVNDGRITANVTARQIVNGTGTSHRVSEQTAEIGMSVANYARQSSDGNDLEQRSLL